MKRSSRSAPHLRAGEVLVHLGHALPPQVPDYFPGGFRDEKYIDWERGSKWRAHEQWNDMLGQNISRALAQARVFSEIAGRAVRIELRARPDLFLSEKMACAMPFARQAGARAFATGLYDILHGPDEIKMKFERWCAVIAKLPRKQTRVLTWPMVTVFGFIAQPKRHIFLKPNVTRVAARQYHFDFQYRSRPSWKTYASLLAFARVLRRASPICARAT